MRRRGRPRDLLDHVLREVPSVLDRLSDQDKARLAATRWSTLEAVLRGCRAALRVHPDDPVLQVLARRMEEGPCEGQLSYAGVVGVPATCAGTLLAVMRELGEDLPARGDEPGTRHCKWLHLLWHLAGEEGLRLTELAAPAFRGSGVEQVPQALSLQQILLSPQVRERLRFLDLDLSNFSAGEGYLAALVDATRGLAALKQLDLTGVRGPGAVWAPLIDELGALTHLALWDASLDEEGTRAFYRMLTQAVQLRQLKMTDVSLDPAACPEQGICPPRCLEVIEIKNSDLDFGWTRATHLRALRLDCDQDPDGELAEVAKLMRRSKVLRRVHLRYAVFPEATRAAILTALARSTVEIFECGWTKAQSATAGVALPGNTAHDDAASDADSGGGSVDVGSGPLGLAAALTSNQALQEVSISACGSPGIIDVPSIATALEASTGLRALHLHGCGIGDEHAAAIGQMLARNRSLVTLSLPGSSLTHRGVRRIARGLRRNDTLRGLHLSEGAHLGCPSAKEFATALVDEDSACQLQLLDLARCGIRDEGAQHLAKLLKEPRCKLRELDLGRNKIGDAGVVAIASALASNSALVSLSLQSNRMSRKGVDSLASSLEKNSTLRTLRLTLGAPDPWDGPVPASLERRLLHAQKHANALRQLVS